MADPATAHPLHLQDLEFDKNLKILLQKIQRIYHTPEKTLDRISVIVSRSQHRSTPAKRIVKKVHKLSSFKPDFIQYFTREISALFPQHRKVASPSSNTGSGHSPYGHSDIKVTNHTLQGAGSGVSMEDNSQDRDDTSSDDNGNSENSNGWNSTDNSNNNGASDSDHSGKGSDHTDDTSDLRSTLSSNRQNKERMTLEARSLHCLLEQGQPRLVDEIYQHIGHQDTFQSFLELLYMYDTRLIDAAELVQRVSPFFGLNKALLDRLQQGIMDDRIDDEESVQIPTDSMSPSALRSTLTPSKHNGTSDADSASVVSSASFTSSSQTMNRNRDYNASYRWIPTGLRNENCSGRDDTCWEVLNDEYVSHPTWASEDNGFLSSNKSKSEERLHQVEDERYALDIEISLNSDILALMEGYLKQIMDMSPRRQKTVRLCPENEGYSTFGYTHAIKKLYYTREKQQDIIKSLKASPVTVLPGIIKLMKQKDIDLRRQKTEKQHIWSDTVAKNYYKFLDYQWENNKPRKTLSTEQLITEIDALWHEQQLLSTLQKQQDRSQQLLDAASPILHPLITLPPPQLVYDFWDSSIINDICDLMRVAANEQLYNLRETTAIRRFIAEFIPPLCGLPPTEQVNPLLTPQKNKAPITTRAQRQAHPPTEIKQRPLRTLIPVNHRVFIGDTPWYCMIRYFQMVYESLSLIKSIDDKYSISPNETKRKYAAVVDLRKGSHLLGVVDIDLSQGYYQAALEIIAYFLKGRLEQLDLEDGIRYLFGVQAYMAFNTGNTINSLVHKVHRLTLEPDLDKVFELFMHYQPYQPHAVESVLKYRSQLDALIGPTRKKYMMIVNGKSGQLSLQLLGDHQVVFPQRTKDYLDYVESYQSRKRKTTGVKKKHLSKVFLNRNLEPEDNRANSNVFLKQDLEYEICQATYHMGFVEGTEDMYTRQIIGRRQE